MAKIEKSGQIWAKKRKLRSKNLNNRLKTYFSTPGRYKEDLLTKIMLRRPGIAHRSSRSGGEMRECYGCGRVNSLSHPVAARPLTTKKRSLVKLFFDIMCQLQISVHHSLFIYKTSREPMPTARGSLHSPTPASRIQGLPGAPPPDPWLHPNINVGCALSQY